jgi:hypothetical protein
MADPPYLIAGKRRRRPGRTVPSAITVEGSRRKTFIAHTGCAINTKLLPQHFYTIHPEFAANKPLTIGGFQLTKTGTPAVAANNYRGWYGACSILL